MARLLDLGPMKGDLKRKAKARREVAGDIELLFNPTPERRFDPLRPSCLECGPKAIGRLVSGEVIYPRRNDLHDRYFYQCPNDPTHYVGTHLDSGEREAGSVFDYMMPDVPLAWIRPPAALGFMCGKGTRWLRSELHKHFDPIWKRRQVKHREAKGYARTKVYVWLAEKLGIPDAHISRLNAAQLRRAIEICKPIHERIEAGEL